METLKEFVSELNGKGFCHKPIGIHQDGWITTILETFFCDFCDAKFEHLPDARIIHCPSCRAKHFEPFRDFEE